MKALPITKRAQGKGHKPPVTYKPNPAKENRTGAGAFIKK